MSQTLKSVAILEFNSRFSIISRNRFLAEIPINFEIFFSMTFWQRTGFFYNYLSKTSWPTISDFLIFIQGSLNKLSLVFYIYLEGSPGQKSKVVWIFVKNILPRNPGFLKNVWRNSWRRTLDFLKMAKNCSFFM